MNTGPETLNARILAVLAQGPGKVEEIRPEIGHVSAKAIGMAISRLIDKGKVVRLWLDKETPRAGGPCPWVFGLAGVRYHGQSLKSKILAALAGGNGTGDEIADEIGHSRNGTAASISDLRHEGKVKRIARAPSKNPRGVGVGPWIYGLGKETRVKPAAPPRKPDPARIAGPVISRQLVGWGGVAMTNPVIIGNATLYLGRALDLRESFGEVNALIGDPPYGQAYKVNTFYRGGSRDSSVVQRNGKTLMVRPTLHDEIEGDDTPFDPTPWLDVAPVVVLWGAHKYADRLPPGGWLVWDKVPTGKVRDQGDGEAAWINDDRPMRIFRLLWDGLCVGIGARHEVTAGQKRYHPMQKPEALMRWCIEQAGRPKRILDPWMGSGSTGVAAIQMGLEFVGCEINQHHFDTACERIENAQRQARMFA